jgi:uncharacterized protein
MRIFKMYLSKKHFAVTGIAFISLLIYSCNNNPNNPKLSETAGKPTIDMKKTFNAVVYFEIPVTEMDRAVKFYTAVFRFSFEKDTIDNNEMALFPFTESSTGISGALAKGEIYKPSKNGTLIYFRTDDIDETLQLVKQNEGKILYPKTSNGDLGFAAEFEDSEGNRIALHMEKR